MQLLDLFFISDVYGITNDYVTHTTVASTLSVHVGHHLLIPTKSSNISQMFSNFSINIWIAYVVMVLSVLTILNVKLLLLNWPLHKIWAEMMLYYGLFIRQNPHGKWKSPWLSLNIMTSAFIINFVFETLIKTDKVVVDLSLIINTIDKVLASKRTLIWFHSERLSESFSKAAHGTWQQKIWDMPKAFIAKDTRSIYFLRKHADTLLGIQNFLYL